MLRAGWSRADITPPAGVDLCGFGGRAGPSQGVHDPLSAKALCVTDGERRIALITADLIGLDAGTVTEVRRRVGERFGREAPALMIACSHTHSGPSTPCLPFLGVPDPAYMESLIATLADLVVKASSAMSEAEIAFGQAEVQVGINRRQRVEEGRIVLGRNEDGTTAPYVDVLRAQTGIGCAVLFSHTAHPVTLGGDNLLISADWPGYAQHFVEEALGERCVALYGQGCCGNINSDPRGSFEIAEQQGRAVAEAVAKAAATLRPAADGAVGAASEVVELPLQDPPPLDEAQALLAFAVRERDANAATDNHGMKLTRQGLVAWGERLVALAEAGATHLTQPFEVQALRIADTAIVGLPGEVFVEYQHQIKACSPFAQTFVLAYANGNIGYVPTEEAFPQGGYEVDSAIKYYGTTMLTPECEHVVVGGVRRLLRTLWPSNETHVER
jgi:neutral ceramidase